MTIHRHISALLSITTLAVGLVVTMPFAVRAATSPPTIVALSTVHGPAQGGNTVTVIGTGLSEVTAVTFGGKRAAIRRSTATRLTVTAPKHRAGQVTIRAVSRAGTARAEGYTYVAAPKVTALTKHSGPHYGGNTVVIRGKNLGTTSLVTVGGHIATLVSVKNKKVTVKMPAHTTGRARVTVITDGGTASAGKYRYRNARSSATTGSVTGTVTTDGKPIAGVSIAAFQYVSTGPAWQRHGSTVTNRQGRYTIVGMAPGEYQICTNVAAHVVKQCVDSNPGQGIGKGRDIFVNAGTTSRYNDMEVLPGGSISGRVTTANGPLKGASVHPYRVRSDGSIRNPGFGTITAADGSFQLDSLEEGDFRVCVAATGPYVTQCFGADPGVGWYSGGSTVPVTVGAQTVGVQLTPVIGGYITGRMIRDDDRPVNHRVDEVQFSLHAIAPSGEETVPPPDFDIDLRTSTPDRFRIGPLPAGTYRLGIVIIPRTGETLWGWSGSTDGDPRIITVAPRKTTVGQDVIVRPVR